MEILAAIEMRGGAHGYAMHGELVQKSDGSIWRRAWGESEPPDFEPTEAIDLVRELELLRTAIHPIRQTRFVWFRAQIRGAAFEGTYARPMIGDAMLDHPGDRIYAAIWSWPTDSRIDRRNDGP